MNWPLPSQLKSPDSSSQYSRAIQKDETVTHLLLSPRTVTLRATHSFVPHVLFSVEVIQKMTSTTQPVSQMPPYCDCLTPGKEVNGQMDSLWLSRVETACSDISDSLCSSECYTLLSEAGLH